MKNCSYKVELDNATTDGIYLGVVKLLHAPNQEKVRVLRAEMRLHGWEGRPVILASREDDVYAMTGTHRLSAVRNLPIAIPAIWLPENLSTDEWHRIDWAVLDYERLKVFCDLAEERNEDWTDVISLARIEAHALV
jgi:hypothetical protein